MLLGLISPVKPEAATFYRSKRWMASITVCLSEPGAEGNRCGNGGKRVRTESEYFMAYKRILTIQDISCVGQCSMTVAMPILSACGHECCILPTAVLSTHTGGFGKPAVVHLDDSLDAMWNHWQNQGISFDAIYTGYLGSTGAVQAAMEIADSLMAPGGSFVLYFSAPNHFFLNATAIPASGTAIKNNGIRPELHTSRIWAGILPGTVTFPMRTILCTALNPGGIMVPVHPVTPLTVT